MSETSTGTTGGDFVSAAEQVWAELSTAMRQLRSAADVSLRAVEKTTGWGRGSLSQIENGKARPTRAQTEWYDGRFGGDGMLVALYAEARGAHGPTGRGPMEATLRTGDAVEVTGGHAPLGDVVRTGSRVPVGWTLLNTGTVPWHGRRIQRVGPSAAPGLIAGPMSVPLPDCAPGATTSVSFDVAMPAVAATLAACWEIVDQHGRPCYPQPVLLRVVLTGHDGV
ncbi:helix-turn-helix domain-containing protein [Jatrophihabitans endophyticus]|uniref:helix-turn-helix domain-containing protein n=1 Tax=Jatrophihabitans endophyticus TaxID=1206085 RepID=UPI001A0C8DD1|nr:helix-turn-helix domain-containing protein [Jatrophihabitans endophyticus]MBE7188551.1 helix-turn-helix domain-containing protein [Jatrophihabitans endophyticus]